MKRHISAKLKKWKSSKNRKPLILKGARQVGKTWAMKDFGRSEFEQMVYVNFERDKLLQNLFKQDFDPERILLALQVSAGITIEPENTLIVLDEIQEVKGGLTALKYFNEEKPEYAIIAASSLLGVSLAGGSFPVGKVEFLEMHPMTFSEFLMAMEENQLLDLIKSLNWDLIKTFKPKIVELLKQYYFTGGMPEAVKSFSREKNFRKVREIQENILNAYDNDFSKHTSPDLIPKISLLWHSLPAQLARENKKFVYGIVKKGARGRDYDKALNWLEQYGLTYRVERITKPGFPLKSYADLNAFKLFASDVGLLGALAGLDEKILLDGNSMFTEFKGALTEQYVLQQLISENEIKPFYWSHEN
ncbi:MAG: AAA family ATPase, partial [Moheibacter sp.]